MRGCRSGQTGEIKALVAYACTGSNPVSRISCIRNSAWIEYLRPKEGVEGSNPSERTVFVYCINDFIASQKKTVIASVVNR